MRATQQTRLIHLTDKERQAATEFVESVRQRFGSRLLSAILFGSRARGDAQPDSDMDILLVMAHAGPQVRREIRGLAVEIWLKHGIYISTRIWSQSRQHEMEQRPTLLYHNIVREGIDLLEKGLLREPRDVESLRR